MEIGKGAGLKRVNVVLLMNDRQSTENKRRKMDTSLPAGWKVICSIETRAGTATGRFADFWTTRGQNRRTRIRTKLTTRARTELRNGEAMVWWKSATVQSVHGMVMELARTNISFLVTGKPDNQPHNWRLPSVSNGALLCCSRDVVAVSV